MGLADGALDLTRLHGRAFAGVLAVMAACERHGIRERIKAG
jgi:DNA invertase Pin-like site-specific DNA recombinase